MIFLNATASSLFLGLSGIAPFPPQNQMHRLSPKNGFTAAVSFCRRGFTKSFSRSRKFAAVVLRNHSVAAESLPPWLYEIIQSQQKETRLIINHLCVFSLMHRKTDIQQEPSNTMDEENKNIFYCCCPAAC